MSDNRSADQQGPVEGGPCENTDRHLWPQTSDPNAETESIHVTAQGGIGINVGGFVYVKTLREWHKLAGGKWSIKDEARTSNQWCAYRRVGEIEARPYIAGDENLSRLSISPADRKRSSLDGGMIARNPDNHEDTWYIAPEYFAKHYSASETKARRIGPDTPNNDMVICPHCTSQFVAIPVNVQGELSRLRKFTDQFPDEPDDPPCEHRNRSPGADYNEWCDDCGGMLPASPSKTSSPQCVYRSGCKQPEACQTAGHCVPEAL